MEGIDPEPEHEQQVTRLALMLFDALTPLHGLGSRERQLLEAAGLVHDIGMKVSEKRHHKHSYELIKKHRFLMWRSEEVDVFALTARYHRKAEPSVDHSEFAALPERDRNSVRKLAAILRLADGLDRAHLSTVQRIEVTIDSTVVGITLHSYRDCATEIWGAERKTGLFESVFSKRVNLQAADGFHGSAP